VDNFGLIQVIRNGQILPDPNAQAIGSFNNVGMDFINESAATVGGVAVGPGRVIGNLVFAGGDDTDTLNPRSLITGNLDGGRGSNLITLNASATSSDSMTGQVINFQTMRKTGAGTWTLTGAIGNNGGAVPLAVEVVGGTLVLTGNNASFDGSITIDPGATLEGRAQSLRGNSVAASLEADYPIPLGCEGLSLEPQVQFVYQHLNFTQCTDVDGIAVNLGNQSQGVFRGGARLTKQLTAPDGTLFTPLPQGQCAAGDRRRRSY
jgi:type V secretory pathway adhesin AidA